MIETVLCLFVLFAWLLAPYACLILIVHMAAREGQAVKARAQVEAAVDPAASTCATFPLGLPHTYDGHDVEVRIGEHNAIRASNLGGLEGPRSTTPVLVGGDS